MTLEVGDLEFQVNSTLDLSAHQSGVSPLTG